MAVKLPNCTSTMAGLRKLAVLFWIISFVTILSTGIGYVYITTRRDLRKIHTERDFPPECYNHSELCQLRSVLQDQDGFGLPLSSDLFDFTPLAPLKNTYIAQGLDLSKIFENTADMRGAIETYRVDEYSFEAVKHVVDKAKKGKRHCKPPNDVPFTYYCQVSRNDSRGKKK